MGCEGCAKQPEGVGARLNCCAQLTHHQKHNSATGVLHACASTVFQEDAGQPTTSAQITGSHPHAACNCCACRGVGQAMTGIGDTEGGRKGTGVDFSNAAGMGGV